MRIAARTLFFKEKHMNAQLTLNIERDQSQAKIEQNVCNVMSVQVK